MCPCAARTCGSPAGTVRTPGGWRSRASAALSGCATREEGWESSPSQPKDPSFLALSPLQPLASPARNGAPPGVPARPPAAWAWPPECPIRTVSAAWKPSAACAYWGPAHPPGATAQGAEPFRARLRMEALCQPLGRQSGLQATVRLGSAIRALEDKRVPRPAGPSGP